MRVTLRLKTALIIAGIMLVAGVVMYAAVARILDDQVTTLENVEMREEAARAVAAVDYHLGALDGKMSDWAAWDDTYSYVVDRNRAYEEANLLPECFESLQVNALAILDTHGRLVWGRARVLHGGTLEPLPAEMRRLIAPGSPLLDLKPAVNYSKTGIVLIPQGVLLIAARPILTSTGRGPSRGVLVMARYLDDEELALVSRVVGLPMAVAHEHMPLPPDFAAASRALSGHGAGVTASAIGEATLERSALRTAVMPSSDTTVSGYTTLFDINGRPAMLLRVQQRRSARLQARTSLSYLGLSLLAGSLLAMVGVWGLTDRVVLSRLAALSRGVRVVGDSRDLTVRADVPRARMPDELSSLANDINAMLYALEGSQAALEESEGRYRAVVEQASDSIFLVDLSTGRILEANDVFQRTLGYSADEAQELTLGEVLAEQSEADAEVMRARSGSGKVNETLYRKKDGTTLPVEEASNVVNLAGEQVMCVVARDITERRQIEQLKDDFSALVSHELRSPLTSILGFVTVLEKLLGPEVDERVQKSVARISTRAQDMNRLVDDLTNFAKVRDGHVELFLESTDIGELVRERVDSLPLSPRHQIVVDVADGVQRILCDRDRIGYVVTNLVTNAIKYSPDGGRVKVTVRGRGDRVAISVADQGVGIAREDLGRVFERFSQSRRTSGHRMGGIGLGLYVSREIVQAHKGYIEVDSQCGKGSTFTVDLPIRPSIGV
jgi:PAS domain S-box-containing protein